MKKSTIIWIIVGVLVLVGIILIWRAMDKSKQDREDAAEERQDASDPNLPETKKGCRKYCRQMCKQKYRGRERRQCKRQCKQDCFSNLGVAEINY